MDGDRKRLLIIDDDDRCRGLLEVQLELEGYAVQAASSGSTGIEEMRKRRFDTVIADSHLPEVTGSEFAEFSKTTWRDTPVILLSRNLNYLTESIDQFDAAICIRKPYEPSMLMSVLRMVTQPLPTGQAV